MVNKSFATFMILCPTSFFLGILFSSFPYDYPLLWTSAAVQPAYLDVLESHLKFLHASPPIIPRILHIVVAVGFCGFFMKLYKPSESNMLFDGASLVLYICGVTVYITNIVKGLRVVTLGIYNTDLIEGEGDLLGSSEGVIGREDSLKVMAASNTILALVLVGVLVLQTGQWYAERKEKEEVAKMDRDAKSSPKTPTGKAGSSKKKQ